MKTFWIIALFIGCAYPIVLTRKGGREFLPVLGRKCSLLAREDGEFEVWFYPFKAFYKGDIAFEKEEKKIPLSQIPREVLVSPAISSLILNSEIVGRIDLLCSYNKPLCLLQFHLGKNTAQKILISFQTSLQLMWPASAEGEIKLQKEAPNKLVFSRYIGGRRLLCLIACDKPFEFAEGRLEIETGEGEVSLAISGGVDNIEEARMLVEGYVGEYMKLLGENEEVYEKFLGETAELKASNASLNEAFNWAKVGLDKCFLETELGNGFIAGYNMANEGGRPGFAWFFGRDSVWMSFPALSIGDFSKVRENLLLQRKYQIKEGKDKGRIYHELSLAHNFFPNPSYAYPAGDSTPLYVILSADYIRWSGDRDFLRESWGSILEAMEWCERMDVDGDLLMDNPPAGHQWFDYGEKNMIDLVAIWQKALGDGAWMAGIMGREDLKARWLEKAEKIKEILNRDFWNEEKGYFYDRKLPDGSFLDIATCNPLIPMLFQQIEEEKAQRALSLLSSPLFFTNWGVRTTAKDEKIYDPWGYHEGTVWPLVTGWASWAQFLNCRPEEGYGMLLSNANMTRDFCLGYIPEILNGDRYEAGGCPLQGWSEAMVISPLLRGMLGLEPNALEKKIKLTIHIPKELDFLELRNIRIGGNKWEIEWEKGKGTAFSLKKEGEDVYSLYLEFSLEEVRGVRALVDGREVGVKMLKKPCGYHALIEAPFRREIIFLLS